MSQNLCKLCLFKSEPEDEIVIEESQQLQQIIDELFSKMVRPLTAKSVTNNREFPGLIDKNRDPFDLSSVSRKTEVLL